MKKFLLAILVAVAGVAVYYYFPEARIDSGKTVDKIVLHKSSHKLEIYSGDQLLKTYSVSLNKKPKDGQDLDEDRSVPAGDYSVFDKDERSKYRKSIGFSNDPEILEAAKSADKKKKKTGFRIHGMKRGYGFIGKFHRWTDWTKGGIALTDDEIDDLFAHVEIGVPVSVHD